MSKKRGKPFTSSDFLDMLKAGEGNSKLPVTTACMDNEPLVNELSTEYIDQQIHVHNEATNNMPISILKWEKY